MAGVLLHMKGVDVTVYERTELDHKLPKAHIVNSRTGELFREIGLMAEVERLSAPDEKCQYMTWSESIAGVQYGALNYNAPPHDFSPARMMNIAQNRLEEVLLKRARALGGRLLFNHSVTAVTKVGAGAELEIETPDGRVLHETFDYVLACDGPGSPIRKTLGIEMVGLPSLARFISCYFTADLERFLGDKPGPVRFLASPDITGGVIGFDVAKSWALMMSYPEDCSVEEYTPEIMHEMVARAIGDRSVAFEINAIGNWNMSAQIAAQFRDGPFFLLGDAAHRMPPTGGLGLNTGLQDAHNLAWKLSWVDRGLAHDALLDTYETERKPVSERNNEYSVQNAIGMVAINTAIGAQPFAPVPPSRANEPLEGLADLGLATDSHGREERLAAIHTAVSEYERKYDLLNIEIGYDYCVRPEESSAAERAEADYHPSVEPGRLIPHVWLDEERSHSLQDLIDRDAFTLFASSKDSIASREIRAFCAEFGFPLTTVEVGAWAPEVVALWRERTATDEQGAILVQPDGHVAWSTLSLPDDAGLAALRNLARRFR
jgi:2-polyprenyl-6-methoxyphenol hydroxylase-like FAD-dependent oxidoreductase